MGRSHIQRTTARVLALAAAAVVATTALVGPAMAATDSSGKLTMTKTNRIECDGDNKAGTESKSSAVIKLSGGKDGKVTAEVTINDGAKNAEYDVKIIQSSPKSSCGGDKETVKTDKDGDAKVTLNQDRKDGRTGAFVVADGPGPILVTKTFAYDGD